MIHEIIEGKKRKVEAMDFKSIYQELASKIATLVESKQLQYGDSFGNAHLILGVLYPNGIPKEQYPNALTITRIVDKLFRISRGDQGDESAWTDITGYGLLAMSKEQKVFKPKS